MSTHSSARSPRSSSSSSSSSSHSGHSSSSHSGHSSSSHSSSSSHHHHHHRHNDGGSSPRRHVEENVVTEVRGQREPVTVSGKAEVLVKTKESWDYEALQKLEEKIASEKAAMIDAEKLLTDQKTLYSEALQTKEKRMADSLAYEKLVADRGAERDRWLNEEKELELKRATAHARAVETESRRTETLAQAVLAKEEANVSENLAIQRSEGIKQAQAIVDAHRLALQKLEEHRMELKKKEVDVSVKGESIPQARAVDINVAVKPVELPEARVVSKAVVRGAGAQSHIQENIPSHSKTVLPAGEVKVSEQHLQQTTVERHVVSQKDRIVN